MLPIKLEIHNFLAYRAPDPVRFDGVHLACLTGSNGAGKSSLLDAITWALWGRARGRRDEELIHIGQGDMSVQLDFEQEGTVYRVWRQRSRKGSTGTLELFSISADGELVPLTEQNMRATQAKINRLLRLDYETFTHSAFLQQGRADAFTTKTPQERKKILSEILGLARWEGYEDQAKEELRTIERDIVLIEAEIKRIDAELLKEPQLRAGLSQALIEHEAAQKALEIAEKSLAEVQNARTELMNAHTQLADAQKRIQERQREKGAADGEIARQRERISGYQAVIARRDEIEKGYDALQTARTTDSSLGALLMQISDIDTRRGALELDLLAAKGEIERELATGEAELRALDEAIVRGRADDLSELQQEIAQLTAVEDERERLTEQTQLLKQEQESLRATNSHLKTEMDAIKERLDKLQSVREAVCPLCGQPLDEAHRLRLLEEIAAEGRQRGDLWRANKGRQGEIQEALKAHAETLTAYATRIQAMPTMRQRLGELAASVDQADKARARRAATGSLIDGLRGRLESGDYAHEIRDEIAKLNEQRDQLAYDPAQHSAAQQSVQTYLQFEQQRTQLEVAVDGLMGAEEILANALARLARIEHVLGEEQAHLEATQVEIARLEVRAHEQMVREQEMLKQRVNERNANNKAIEATQALKALDDLRLTRPEQDAKLQARREDELIYTSLRDAFGKKGIPAMIIEAAIPELEKNANAMLSRMTDGRMQVRLDTQREKVTGGVAETLDIHIADELGTRSYEMYSGGEAFRINFALRVALSQLLARRAGAHLRTLFIDEGFGTQDDEGRNKLVEAITAIQDSFDIILVVTHIDELRDSFPVHLQVTKTSDGSYVAIR